MSIQSTSTRQPHQELFFDSLVSSYVNTEENPRFLRRDWLSGELGEMLKASGRQFILLTAEPGAGKSAFFAQLAHDHPEWPRYFIRRDQREVLADVSARSLLLRIGYQIAERRPELFSKEQLNLSVTQRLGEIAEQGEAVGVEVERLIASPFYQMALDIEQHVRVNRGKVVALRVEELYVEERQLSAEDLLQLALVHPALALQRIEPNHQLVILIDALDEIRYHQTMDNIVAWLTNCPDLPENVRFVLTSRPPDEVLANFCEKQASRLSRLKIEEKDPRVLQDIARFVKSLVGEPAFAKALTKTEGGAEEFEAKARVNAQGNLGYLGALARGIDQALEAEDMQTLEALLSLQELPGGLPELYAFFLHQIKQGVAAQQVVGKDSLGKTFSVDVWPAVYEPVLGVLAVAAEPLESQLIARLGDIAVELKWVSPALKRLQQFLDLIDGSYRLYHSTVAEFLTAERTRKNPDTKDLYCDAEQWHLKIADYYWRYRENWGECEDGYGFDNLAVHLAELGAVTRLRSLFEKDWVEVRYEKSGRSFSGLTADIETAWTVLTRATEINLPGLVRLKLVASVIGERVYASDLSALIWLDRQKEALGLARAIDDPVERVRNLLAIAGELREKGEDERDIIEEAWS